MPRHAIDRIVFLIHPFAYGAVGADPVRAARFRAHLDYEARIAARWFAGIDEMAGRPDDALIACTPIRHPSKGVDYLEACASDLLGDRAVVLREQPVSEPFDEMTHPRACGILAERIAAEFDCRGLSFDPRTVRAESWGESFEGCAANYGRLFGPLLGIERRVDLRYDLAVPDNALLLDARLLGTTTLDRDVVLFRWEAADGRQVAWFHRSRACPGDPPYVVRLPISGPSVEVRAHATGDPVWPAADSICRVEDDWLIVPIWGIPAGEPVWGKHVIVAASDDPLDAALADARIEIAGP